MPEPGIRGPDPGNGGGGGGPADPGRGGGIGIAEPGKGGGGGILEPGKGGGGGTGGPADPGKGGGGGITEPGKAGGGGGRGGAGLPGNGDKNDPPRGGGGGGGGGAEDGVEAGAVFRGGMAGIGVEVVVHVSIILSSSLDCFEIIALSSSSSEFNKNPPCSFLFIFEHRFTNFSIVSQTTSIKLSSSVSANRLCKMCKKLVA